MIPADDLMGGEGPVLQTGFSDVTLVQTDVVAI